MNRQCHCRSYVFLLFIRMGWSSDPSFSLLPGTARHRIWLPLLRCGQKNRNHRFRNGDLPEPGLPAILLPKPDRTLFHGSDTDPEKDLSLRPDVNCCQGPACGQQWIRQLTENPRARIQSQRPFISYPKCVKTTIGFLPKDGFPGRTREGNQR